MLTEIMEQHKLITGTWWEPLPSSANAQRTRAVRALLERQRRTIRYEVTPADKKMPRREYFGLVAHSSAAWESLAVYIRLLYGNGVFFSRISDNQLWLLIIHEGVIIPGSDCVVSQQVFDLLMEGRKFSAYKGLDVQELSTDCEGQILEHYHENQKRLKKRRVIMYTVAACFVLVLLSIPLIFTLIG